VAGAVLARFPDGVVVVAGALDDAGVGALTPGVEVPGVGNVGQEAVQDPFLLVRGEKPGLRPGGG